MNLKELAEMICRFDESEGLSPAALGALKDFASKALSAQPVVLTDEQKRQLVKCLHGGISMGWIEEDFALELGATILAFAAKEQA